MTAADILGTVLRIACALLAWRFVIRFARVSWARSDEGRYLMGFGVIVAVFMTLASVVTLHGPFWGYEFVAVALYGWLAYLLARQNQLLSKAQREHDSPTD